MSLYPVTRHNVSSVLLSSTGILEREISETIYKDIIFFFNTCYKLNWIFEFCLKKKEKINFSGEKIGNENKVTRSKLLDKIFIL